jgi:glycosyltransferase involved in cell wall biosynthesis
MPGVTWAPQLAGDAGVYVNLNSAEDLKTKIQLMVSNPSVRQDFSKKSLERAKRFTWSQAAAQCFEVYKRAIEKSKLQAAK